MGTYIAQFKELAETLEKLRASWQEWVPSTDPMNSDEGKLRIMESRILDDLYEKGARPQQLWRAHSLMVEEAN